MHLVMLLKFLNEQLSRLFEKKSILKTTLKFLKINFFKIKNNKKSQKLLNGDVVFNVNSGHASKNVGNLFFGHLRFTEDAKLCPNLNICPNCTFVLIQTFVLI
jgi:hypothetical protein